MDIKLPVDPLVMYKECFSLNLKRAARAVGRRYDEALKPVDLTNGQFATLAVIAEFQPLSMQTLAERLSMDRTTLTAALKPLERRALVSVRPDHLDRRGRNVNLTDEGIKLLRNAIPLWKKLQRRITREMGTSGLAVFRAQLAQLSRAMSAEAPEE
jgi:DNA-binding MarR family transcriptional regulator